LDGHLEAKIAASDQVAYSVSFDKANGWLAIGTYEDVIGIWDVSNISKPREVDNLQGHEGDVLSVSFAPDGHLLASGSWDKTLRLWEVSTGKNIVEHSFKDLVRSVAFSPDGIFLASCSEKGEVIIWGESPP